MLLNGFLKQHCTIKNKRRSFERLNLVLQSKEEIMAELTSTVAEQQESFQSKLADQGKQIEALASGLQKVSAKLNEQLPLRWSDNP